MDNPISLSQLKIAIEERKLQRRDQLNDLCLRYGGPGGGDWAEQLKWLEAQLASSARAR